MFMKNIGTIPRPMEVLSVSPALFEIQLKRIGYFANHPALSYALLVHIRYLASHSLAYPFCTDFNRHLLHKQGMTDDDIRQLEDDPNQALLEEHETAMLVFVMKAMKAPGTITAADTQHLRELGWNDRDMVDALAQGVGMIDHAIMMEAFQIDQQCLMG
jgi:alkylhydroperoxidase family enzyme